jgi:hypothetical protein
MALQELNPVYSVQTHITVSQYQYALIKLFSQLRPSLMILSVQKLLWLDESNQNLH